MFAFFSLGTPALQHRDDKLFGIRRTHRAVTRGELPFGTDVQMYAWAAASAAAADEAAARAAAGRPRIPTRMQCNGRRNATQPTAVVSAFLLGGKNAHGGSFGKQKAANLFKLTKAMLDRSSGLCAPGVSLHVVHDTPPEHLMLLQPVWSNGVFVSHDASPTASPATPHSVTAADADGNTQGRVARLQGGGGAAARAAARLDAASAPPGRVTYHYFSRLAQLPPDVRR